MRDSFGVSDVGCVRTNNEDHLLVAPELGLWAVADGMGGASAGELASQIAAESLREFVSGSVFRDEVTLTQAFERANQAVLETAAADPRLEGMGTTMVCVMEWGAICYVASVGDSRAWRYSNGSLSLVTNDQTWVNEIGRPLGLSEEKLKVHPMRHVLTMAVGVNQSLRVQVYPLYLQPGDVLLLCSDGLHGPVADTEIEKILAQPISLEARCHYLIEAAKRAGGPDNVTVLLLEY